MTSFTTTSEPQEKKGLPLIGQPSKVSMDVPSKGYYSHKGNFPCSYLYR